MTLTRSCGKNIDGQFQRPLLDQVLEVIQEKQHAFMSKIVEELLGGVIALFRKRSAGSGRSPAVLLPVAVQGCERDSKPPSGKSSGLLRSRLCCGMDCQAGFADPTRASQAQKAGSGV